MAGAISLELAQEVIKMIERVKLVRITDDLGEITYEPQRTDVENPCEVCKGFKRFKPLFNPTDKGEETCNWCDGTGINREKQKEVREDVSNES